MNNDDLEQIEEEFKEAEKEEEKTQYKVSGRSVFELERIIASKKEGKNGEDKSKRD